MCQPPTGVNGGEPIEILRHGQAALGLLPQSVGTTGEETQRQRRNIGSGRRRLLFETGKQTYRYCRCALRQNFKHLGKLIEIERFVAQYDTISCLRKPQFH